MLAGRNVIDLRNEIGRIDDFLLSVADVENASVRVEETLVLLDSMGNDLTLSEPGFFAQLAESLGTSERNVQIALGVLVLLLLGLVGWRMTR